MEDIKNQLIDVEAPSDANFITENYLPQKCVTEDKCIEPLTTNQFVGFQHNDDQGYIESKYHEPIRLVFVQINRCYVCDKLQNDVNCLILGRLYGWLYCNNCINDVKSSVKIFINNNNIPLHWLFGSNKFNNPDDPYSKKIFFFRNSKKGTQYEIQESLIRYFDMDEYDYGCYMIQKFETMTDNKYGVYLFFNDIQTGERQCRTVSLANIFAHTNGLYEELINCKNIFDDNKIVIGFDDLSLELKNEIHDAYKMSCTKDKRSYNK